MTLPQLFVLALIVAVVWLGSKLKKHEERIEELESEGSGRQVEESPGGQPPAGNE